MPSAALSLWLLLGTPAHAADDWALAVLLSGDGASLDANGRRMLARPGVMARVGWLVRWWQAGDISGMMPWEMPHGRLVYGERGYWPACIEAVERARGRLRGLEGGP